MAPLSPAVYSLLFLVGLCFGSFLNVIICRLPQGKSIVKDQSSCPQCGRRLGLLELIPVFGYLALKGRCRGCSGRIGLRYPLVELAVGALFVLVFRHYGLTPDAIFYLVLLFILLGIALIDLEHRIVPNSLVAAGLIAAALFYLPVLADIWLTPPAWLLIGQNLPDALLGLFIGGVVMLLIFLVSRGGMGAGDIKLLAMIGFFVGLRGTAVVMLLGFFIGALVGVAFMITGRLTRKDALPFAPFLSIAALIQVLWGEALWAWYSSFLP